jgi:antibiotic biosynthesis monooxygenase (ABM) superfamily enzyme
MEKEVNSAEQDDPPVTVVVTRRVKKGCDRAFEALLRDVLARIDKYDGYLGHNVIRTELDEASQFQLIFKFDHESNLKRWEDSDERRAWLDEISGLLVEPSAYRVLCGLETWFTLEADKPMMPPPRNRMAAVTWLAVFPLATGVQYLLAPLLSDAPVVIRALILTVILVPAMTYVVMPRMTRLFRRFLFVDEAGR